jgi:hypothetical protein
MGAYLAAAIAAAVVLCATPARWKYLPFLPLVFATYHTSYGIGFLRGLLDLSSGRTPSRTVSTLSR